MGRSRATHSDLPQYVYLKRGWYTYVARDPETGKQKNHRLTRRREDVTLALHQLLQGSITAMASGIVTFGDALRYYRDKIVARKHPSTAKSETFRLAHIARLMDLNAPVTSVLPGDCYAYMATRIEEGAALGSVAVERAALCGIFKHAMKFCPLTYNPAQEAASDVAGLSSRAVVRHVTDDEFNAALGWLISTADTYAHTGHRHSYNVYAMLLVWIGTTGMRPSDAAAMRWSNITPGGILFTPIKTQNSSGQPLLITRESMPTLDTLLAEIKTRLHSRISSLSLFPRPNGSPYTGNTLSQTFGPLIGRIATDTGIQRFTLKDLRKRAGTDMCALGGDAWRLLGHSSQGMTQRHYNAGAAVVTPGALGGHTAPTRVTANTVIGLDGARTGRK